MAALTQQKWYCGSTKWTAVTAWAATTAKTVGNLVRQLAAPTVGNERVFVCIIAGTTLASEPTWVVTKGAKTAEAAGPTWMECTGQAGVNGDLTNCPNWTAVKNSAVALGVVIQRNNAGSLQICTTAGTASNGAEPSFSNTAGTTTSDGTITWTSLGTPGGFAAYAAPLARIQTPFGSTFMAAGDTLYVSNNHAETQAAAMTVSPTNGTYTLPNYCVCVNDSVAPPAATATSATVSTTGANGITVGNNPCYFYGLNFSGGSGSSSASLQPQCSNAGFTVFDTCGFTLNNTNVNSTFTLAGNQIFGELMLRMVNCNFVFGATGQSAMTGNNNNVFEQVGGSWAKTGSVPTSLFKQTAFNNKNLYAVLRDADMLAITGTIVDTSNGNTAFQSIVVQFENCNVGSGATFLSASNNPNPLSLAFHNCDSAATSYRYGYYTFSGSVVNENTIVRTGGASDGTTGLSWNINTTAAASYDAPFACEPITQWNSLTTGTHTATIELTSNTTLTNNNIWVELEYLGTSGNPLGSVVTSRCLLLATPATLNTSGATWGGGALTNKYNISLSFTPKIAGTIKARVCVAAPSIQVYVDPLITVV